MSYLTYAKLLGDGEFGMRARACINEQANAFSDQTGSPVDLLAVDLLKQEALQTNVMLNAIAAGPNFATIIDNGDGTIDSTRITDEDILAHTQVMFSEVARIFYPPAAAPPVPSVTSVAPTSGPVGTTITITGTALTNTSAVTLGGTACTSLHVVSATQVTAVTPAGPNKGSRALDVTVGGNVLTGLTFTVT